MGREASNVEIHALDMPPTMRGRNAYVQQPQALYESMEDIANDIAAIASETVSVISRLASDDPGKEEAQAAAERCDGICRVFKSRDRTRPKA